MMILLKNLIVEGTPGMELVRSIRRKDIHKDSGVDIIGKDKYAVQAAMGLKMLGVDIQKIRYKVLSGGKDPGNWHNSTIASRIRTSVSGNNRGALSKSMWEWGDNVLWEVFETAKNNYKLLVKKYHPDRGGDHEKMALINRAWDVVAKTFKRKGFDFSK